MRTKLVTGVCLDMAASGGKAEQAKLFFWTKPKSSEKDSHVPGVNDLGNLRPRLRGGRTKEIKAVMPVVQPTVEDVDLQKPLTQSLASSSVSQHLLDAELSTQVAAAGVQGLSLRDLCVEDKKRVANLIKELARLGEEKENAEKNLEEERKRYEEQILSLVAQQEQLLKDYEVQKTLVEYQTYILKLQQQQKRHPQQQHGQRQQQTLLPVQPNQYLHQSPPKTSNTHNDTNNVRYMKENIGQENGVQVPLTYIPQSREDLYNGRVDEWQRNMYMNNASGDRVDNCSTEVNPSVSLPVELANFELDLQRPFTAIIDRELAYQRQLLAATENSNRGFPALGTTSGEKMTEKANSPRQNTDIFSQKIILAGHKSEDVHRRVDQNQNHLVSHPQNHLVVTGTRNSEYPHLPAEKTEIIARFMQSQGQVTDGAIMQQMTQNHHNSPAPVTNKVTLHPVVDSGDQVVKSGQELARTHVHGAPRVKKRKPPPSYGPLHAPIMSSTQKSSEFGDCLSVNSSVHVDNRKMAIRKQIPCNADEEVDNVKDNKDCVEHGEVHDPAAVRNSPGNYINMLHKGKKKKEKHDHERGKISKFGEETGEKIVDKYKQLSAIERKTQLLKQRSVLLEEQVKLKKILAEQQYQLQMHRPVAEVPTQQIASEKDDRAYVKMSLAKLEEEVARKELELLREREYLERKRQEYAHKEPGDKSQPSHRQHTLASTNKLTDDQGDGTGHRSSQHGTRTEAEVSPLLADNSRRRHKEKTKTSNSQEVSDKHIIDRDVQAEKAPLPIGVDHIPGNVKNTGKIMDIVKKLDYSLNSDTESDTARHPESVQHSTPASRDGRVNTRNTPPAASKPSRVVPQTAGPPHRTDASTSVSFGHLPSFPAEGSSRSAKRSTGTEMTPRKSTDSARAETRSTPSQQTVDDERQKLSLDRKDRTYTKDGSFILPEDEMLSDVEIIKLLSEQRPGSRSHQNHSSLTSLSKVTTQHDVILKTVSPTHSSQQPSTKHLQHSPALIDTLHLIEDSFTPQWIPPAKSKTECPQSETDPVLELFEVKRPVRSKTSREQHLKEVLVHEHVVSQGCRLGVDKNDVSFGDDEEHGLVDDEVSVEKVIQILNFSNREDVKIPQRSVDVSDTVAKGCTEAVDDDNTDISDDAENCILEDVFFVRS